MHRITFPLVVASLLAITSHTSPTQASEGDGLFRFYLHKGETIEQRRSREPRIGAAHAISLNSELEIGLSKKEREQVREFGPWLTSDGLSNNTQVLVRTIQDARIHGLNPESYELSRILHAVDLLTHIDQWADNWSSDKNQLSVEAGRALRRQLNGLLDNNFIKLIEHLGRGVVDGRNTQSRHYRKPPRVNAFNLLVSVSSADLSVSRALASVMPVNPAYFRLTAVMRNLLTEQSTGVLRTKVSDTNASKLVMQAQDKQAIRERLLETGDLTFDAYMAANPDAELVKALRAFQSRNGIEQSSFADARTRAALNTTVEQDIIAVALNLERWRWLPRDFGDRHIIANIPDYSVSLIDNGKATLSMPAVVGKYEHQTPSFSRNMSYMEFNPTWIVPAKIAEKELLPKERATPGYLESRDFAFLKRIGKHLVSVPASSVTREDFNAVRFPYVLQQRGGPINALGRMKFMMPNQHAIYLHDTQAKKHFTLNDRAYSHGCIRLSQPDKLAAHLMIGDGYSSEKIEKSLLSKNTHRVRFRSPIPTHLVYLTTWVDEDNVLQTRPDIYRNDDRLYWALRTAGTLLSDIDSASVSDDKNQHVAQIE